MERNAAFEKIEQEDHHSHQQPVLFLLCRIQRQFSWVLKMLFDTSKSHDIWFHKLALITGNATGRTGNLRGMDHLADI